MPKKQQDDKFYLGNRNLPRPEQEFEWTPKMARDLKKSRSPPQVYKNIIMTVRPSSVCID